MVHSGHRAEDPCALCSVAAQSAVRAGWEQGAHTLRLVRALGHRPGGDAQGHRTGFWLSSPSPWLESVWICRGRADSGSYWTILAVWAGNGVWTSRQTVTVVISRSGQAQERAGVNNKHTDDMRRQQQRVAGGAHVPAHVSTVLEPPSKWLTAGDREWWGQQLQCWACCF